MVSQAVPTVPADSSVAAARKKGIARFAAFAGVYLFLATVNGMLTFHPYFTCTRRRDEGIQTLRAVAQLYTFMGEMIFAMVALGPDGYQKTTRDRDEVGEKTHPSSSKSSFELTGGLLGLEAAMVLMFVSAKLDLFAVNFWLFVLFWLGFGVEMVFTPIAGAVDRVMVARSQR